MYRFEEKIDEVEPIPAPPVGEHEEIERTEWINPPTVVGARSHRSKSVREASPSVRSSVSRRIEAERPRRFSGTFVEERKTVVEREDSAFGAPPPPLAPPPPGFFEERKTVIEERRPTEIFEERKTIIDERAPRHAGALVIADREFRTDRDIQHEIRRLEAEQRALRLEREADHKRDLAIRVRERVEDEFQLVEYRRPETEVLEIVERPEPRKVVRIEKDRKGRLAFVRSSH